MLNMSVASPRSLFEKLLSNTHLCFLEILHHFQSTICHPHIISEMLQSSHSLSFKYKLLWKSVLNHMLWSPYQSIYSNSEMLAPVHTLQKNTLPWWYVFVTVGRVFYHACTSMTILWQNQDSHTCAVVEVFHDITKIIITKCPLPWR